jgi:acyl carrier protein
MALSSERIHRRLAKLFTQAFPNLAPDSIQAASTETVAAWDSLATLTLFTLAEAEFGISLGYDRLAETQSYDALYRLIEAKAG